MATNYVCKLCGSPSPPVFALSSTDKIPLCADDIGKYISTQHFASQTIFPIAAIAFIDSVSDLPLFEQRTEATNRSDRMIEYWMTAEQDQFQEAIIKLQIFEQKAVAVVNLEFQMCIQKLRNLHEAIVTQLTVARNEITQAKFVKVLNIGTVAELFLSGIEHTNPTPLFFSESVHDVEKQLSKTARTAFSVPTIDGKQFLQGLFLHNEKDKANKLHVSIPELKESVSRVLKPTIEAKEQVRLPEELEMKKCSICHYSLPSVDSIHLAGHESCFVCFGCIKQVNNIKLRCPVCKTWYSEDSKETLMREVPGLMRQVSYIDRTSGIHICITNPTKHKR